MDMPTKPWLAVYGERIPATIDPCAHPSVLAMLEDAMRLYAEKPAFRCFGQTLAYRDVDLLSRDFAAYLQGKVGVKKGDRVAVMMPNIPAFPVAMIGILRAGAAQVNVNPLYTPRELEHQLNDSGAEVIVIFNGVSGTLAEIVAKTKVRHVISAAGVGWSSLPWLRLVKQPTLVMAGTDDPLVPLANAKILAGLIPDARLETLDDGHLFLVTSARRSAELVEAFLL